METRIYFAPLEKSQLEIAGDSTTVKLGWYFTAQFPSYKGTLPDSDTYGFFYLRKDADSDKERLVAVDAVYLEKASFKAVRLFGSEEEVPLSQGAIKLSVSVETLLIPRRRVRIRVIMHEGEQLFECEETKFDLLQAHYQFEGGQVSIVRDGELLDQTDSIHEVGTHAAFMAFCGLKNLFGENHHRAGYTDGLLPDDLKVGDMVLLDMPNYPEFDFPSFLREYACFYGATMEAFKERHEMSMGEAQQLISEKAAQTAEEFVSVPVVRFREKR